MHVCVCVCVWGGGVTCMCVLGASVDMHMCVQGGEC